jgi:hypothetical protein
METWAWRYGDGDMETWRQEIETWKHGNMETWKHGDIDMEKGRHEDTETQRHGDMDLKTWTWRHGIKILGNSDVLQQKKSTGKNKPRRFFSIHLPFAHRANGSFLFKWKFVVCPFVDEETNGSYRFAN